MSVNEALVVRRLSAALAEVATRIGLADEGVPTLELGDLVSVWGATCEVLRVEAGHDVPEGEFRVCIRRKPR